MRLASMMQLICGEMRCRCSMRTVAPALWPHDWRTYSAGFSTFHRRHCWMVSRGIPTLSPSILQSAPVILQLNCSKCMVTHLKYSTLNNGLKWKFSQLKGDNWKRAKQIFHRDLTGRKITPEKVFNWFNICLISLKGLWKRPDGHYIWSARQLITTNMYINFVYQ